MPALTHHLAMYNFGLHVADHDHPDVRGFRLREPLNFAAAAQAAGFVGRSGYDGEPGPDSWGTQVFPRFIEGSKFETGPSSLSLWADIESLMAFSYSGVHADALKHARNWNRKNRWPTHVLWWVSAGHMPEWSEAVLRLESLHDHGPSPEAFSFKQPFAADATPVPIDRDRVKAIALENEAGQRSLLAQVAILPV